MPELAEPRREFEEKFRKRLRGLRGEYRERILAAMGDPPDPRNVPEELLEEMEKRQHDTLFWLLMLTATYAYRNLFAELAKPPLTELGPPPELPSLDELPDRGDIELTPIDPWGEQMARQWAGGRSTELASQMRQTNANRLQRARERAEDIIAAARAELSAAREVAAAQAAIQSTLPPAEPPTPQGGAGGQGPPEPPGGDELQIDIQVDVTVGGPGTRPGEPELAPVGVPGDMAVAGEPDFTELPPSAREAVREVYDDAVDDIFDDRRIDRVAITEVTGAISAGEQALAVRVAGGLTTIWQTERDDRVCPICGPLHGTDESYFGPRVAAPPAHVNCRCWLIYKRVRG